MIKTIIFDLSEVFFKGFYGVEDYLVENLGIKAEEIAHKLQGPEFKLLMVGQITEDEFWRLVINRNHWNVDIGLFKKAIRNNFQEIEGVRDIIINLKQKGYKLVLLSDHCKEWIKYFDNKFKHHRLFDFVLYSFEVNCCKMDRQIFDILLRKLKELPKNCLFIDDNEQNIKVARLVGLNTIKFYNPKQMKQELNFILSN